MRNNYSLRVSKAIIAIIVVFLFVLATPIFVMADDPDPNYVYEAEATLVLPMAGEAPDNTVIYPENSRYTITSFGGWKEGTADDYDATYGETPDIFIYGRTYSFRIQISGTDSYTNRVSKGITKVTINGNSNVHCDSYGGNQFSVVVEFVAGCPHETETINVKAPTYAEDGYTGEQYCSVCDAIVETGEAIQKKASDGIACGNYDGVDWLITTDGELQLGDQQVAQTLAPDDNRTLDVYPWHEHADSITEVEVIGDVILQGSVRGMFADLSNATHYDGISNINTCEVTNMRGMFYGNSSVVALDLSSFNTKKVTDMSGMFNACTNMSNVELDSFNTSNVSSMINMFKGCSSLKELNIASFDTRDVDKMSCIFDACYNLRKIVFGHNFKVPIYVGRFPQIDDTHDRYFYNLDATYGGDYVIGYGNMKPEYSNLHYYSGRMVAAGTIKFVNEDGGDMTAQRIYYGEDAVKIKKAESDGEDRQFLGWADERGDVIFSDEEEVTYNILEEKGMKYDTLTLYAKWGAEDITEKLENSSVESVTYNGRTQIPNVTVEGLTAGVDFKVECENNTNAGTATITLTGIGDKYGSAEKTFEIKPASIADAQLTAGDMVYPCSVQGRKVTVRKVLIKTEDALVLEEGKDYVLSYSDSDGKGTIVIKGTGNYKGSIGITAFLDNHNYDQEEITKEATCIDSGEKTYTCHECKGTKVEKIPATGHTYGAWKTTKAATQTATGVKTRSCTKCGAKQTATIEMLPRMTLSKTAFTWNNKVQTPTVYVKVGNKALSKSYYKVTYPEGRKNVGTYTIKVTLKNGYSGKRSASYTIKPKGTGLTGATAASKAVTVKWARQANKMSTARITGYQIQYSLKKDFKSGNKAVNVGGYTKTSRKITGLASKKTYYFRVRTYLKSGSKTYYSGWSAVKGVKAK